MSGPIKFTQRGSFDNTERYLRGLSDLKINHILEKYGPRGVNALASATPRDSGLTANSWHYSVVSRPGYYSIRWHNTHIEDGVPIAIILQYGHGTRNGGFIEGRNYIMPAIRPVFDQILADVSKEVTK